MSGPGMHLGMQVSQRLEQRQVLSLQTIQSLNILQLATADLQNLISEQLLENPTLETAQGDGEEAGGPDEPAARMAEEAPEVRTEAGETLEEAYDYLSRNTDVEEFVSRSAKARDDGEPDAKQEAFNNLAAPDETLAEHLIAQLRMRDIAEKDWPLLEQIVWSLDERGWLAYPLQDVAASLGGDAAVEDAERLLALLQTLEPRGVGARNLAECLLLQIGEDDPDYPLFRRILTEFWEDLLKNRVPKVARDLGVSVEELRGLVDMLAVLNPHPGTLYSAPPNHYVVPDVVVYEDEDGVFKVRLTRENLPRLSISDHYRKMLEARDGDREAVKFVRNKMTQARQLIDALEQRQSTLERVSAAIVARQQGFMREGVAALKPLKMQEIADELGIHHSTVWRAVYGKFIETPQGAVALNSFFTGGMPKEDGAISREAVKEKLRELVEAEDKRKPLSDMALARKLEEAGITASRRVVTKYREELGIADSRVRRQY